MPVFGVGKIPDIFDRKGITDEVHTEGNADGLAKTEALLDRVDHGLVFVNLVDFDMLYGHRNDPQGYARALEEIDRALPRILGKLRPGESQPSPPTTAATRPPRRPITRASTSRSSSTPPAAAAARSGRAGRSRISARRSPTSSACGTRLARASSGRSGGDMSGEVAVGSTGGRGRGRRPRSAADAASVGSGSTGLGIGVEVAVQGAGARAASPFDRSGRADSHRPLVVSLSNHERGDGRAAGGGTSRPRRPRWTGFLYGDRCRPPDPAGNAAAGRGRQGAGARAAIALRQAEGERCLPRPVTARGSRSCRQGGALRAGVGMGRGGRVRSWSWSKRDRGRSLSTKGRRPRRTPPSQSPSVTVGPLLLPRRRRRRRRRSVLTPERNRLRLDLDEVARHLAPPVPVRVVRVRVERALERAHAVLEEHDEQLLLDGRRARRGT